MVKFCLTVVLLLINLTSGSKADAQEYWAHEFAPKPDQIMIYQGLGDDVQSLEFTVIYHIRPHGEREDGYLVSEYTIFSHDLEDPQFYPIPSIDYYLNEQGLMARSSFEKSQGLMPYLVLPYKFREGDTFIGKEGMTYLIKAVAVKVTEHDLTYDNCVEVNNELGDQLFFMSDKGVVLSLGNDERWMLSDGPADAAELTRKYRIP
ncbi:MAG: hypothetical protein LBJ14_04000 [Desulfarculales bacterium]|jgi:hypothetical protein|nr:hypothetical protein [Desulfarculales bacterium]